jgi:hypothetical protein
VIPCPSSDGAGGRSLSAQAGVRQAVPAAPARRARSVRSGQGLMGHVSRCAATPLVDLSRLSSASYRYNSPSSQPTASVVHFHVVGNSNSHRPVPPMPVSPHRPAPPCRGAGIVTDDRHVNRRTRPPTLAAIRSESCAHPHHGARSHRGRRSDGYRVPPPIHLIRTVPQCVHVLENDTLPYSTPMGDLKFCSSSVSGRPRWDHMCPKARHSAKRETFLS